VSKEDNIGNDKGDILSFAREHEQGHQWIYDHQEVFQPAAIQGFGEQGRGAIVVEKVEAPQPNFDYVPQAEIEDENLKWIVGDYDPEAEFVVKLVKANSNNPALPIHRIWIT
jgi:hypothetical protein